MIYDIEFLKVLQHFKSKSKTRDQAIDSECRKQAIVI